MVVDAFIFFNELDILELRLRELHEAVDHFVLVEATKTFAGKPKPLYYDMYKDRFAAYRDKILHVVLPGLPPLGDASQKSRFWLEKYHRDGMTLGLFQLECTDDDLILMSDVDEIPSKAAVLAARDTIQPNQVLTFAQLFYKYYFDDETDDGFNGRKWGGTVATTYSFLTQAMPQEIRRTHACSGQLIDYKVAQKRNTRVIENAGWHLSSFGGQEARAYKTSNFSHGADKQPIVDDRGVNIIGSMEPESASALPELIQAILQYVENYLDFNVPAAVIAEPERFSRYFGISETVREAAATHPDDIPDLLQAYRAKSLSKASRKESSSMGAEDLSEKVTEEAVVWAYRLFLNRYPENAEVVQEKLRNIGTFQQLRSDFISSGEFASNVDLAQNASGTIEKKVVSLALSGYEPPLQIEDTSDFQELFRHIKTTWEDLGEVEPHWSVLTNDKFKSTELENHRNEFYLSGKADVERLFKTLERNGLDATHLHTCMEYGCGLGRITKWLAERFDSVAGYDISLPHLRLAAQYLGAQGKENIQLIRVSDPEAVLDFPKVDFVYSVIVLQHNPPPLIRIIVRELLKALNPGGMAFFQVPTYWTGYRFAVEEYLRQSATRKEIEMHVLPQKTIFEIIHEQGCIPLEVMEDNYVGLQPGIRSNAFLVMKTVSRAP